MLSNYPFFFTREEPAKLSEAPEQYQKKNRLDGYIERVTHAPMPGKTFPTQMKSVYGEKMENKEAEKDPDELKLSKIN